VLGVLDEFALVEDQIRAADIAVLNKTDLVDATIVAAARALVTRLNPLARVFETKHGDVNLSELFAVEPSPDSHRSEAGGRHATHAAVDLGAVKIALAPIVEREPFLQALLGIPHGVFRVKGVVRFAHDATPSLVQHVAGRTELTPFRDASFDERFLVVIGRGLDVTTLQRTFESCSSRKTEHLA
jgi:G3E family GTPase